MSMTDAMGHTMDAALLATVLVGGLQRAPAGLNWPSRRGWRMMHCRPGGRRPVRYRPARAIDLANATAGIVNAGHPPPLRLRSGQVEQVRLRLTVRSACSPTRLSVRRCSLRWATG